MRKLFYFLTGSFDIYNNLIAFHTPHNFVGKAADGRVYCNFGQVLIS